MTKGFIYKLVDPDTGEIRYVGETARPLLHRMGRHFQSAILDPRNVAGWIRGLIERGRCPLIIILEEINGTKRDRLIAERRWIEQLQAEGHPLMNLPCGARDPAKIGIASKKVWASHTPEQRRRRGENISKGLGGDARKGRLESILLLLKEAPRRFQELVNVIGAPPSTLGNDMADLRRRGLIRREGSTHRAIWHLS